MRLFTKISLFAIGFFLLGLPMVTAQAQTTADLNEDPILGAESLPADTTTSASQLAPPAVTSGFVQAKVLEIQEQAPVTLGVRQSVYQKLKLKIITAPDKDKEIVLNYGKEYPLTAEQLLKVGNRVVIQRDQIGSNINYFIIDVYRLNYLIYLALAFFILVIAIGRLKGFGSLVGLGVSLAVIVLFIIPQVIAGHNPLIVVLIGTFVIALASIYLAHGFNRRTTIAVISTCIALGLAIVLSSLFVNIAHLTGIGSEEAGYLQNTDTTSINLRGLLLGGIILGALGVLDDVTTGLSASVDEIKKANSALSSFELYRRGLSVGQEHISSLVNTLVLAYAGVSLPLFILLQLGSVQPLWVTLNSEFIAEEIIRTLVGSVVLVLAVPITTALAAWWQARQSTTPRTARGI